MHFSFLTQIYAAYAPIPLHYTDMDMQSKILAVTVVLLD